MKLEIFKTGHLETLERQKGKLYSTITPIHRNVLEKNGMSFSAISETGKVCACAGLLKYWENRVEGWAIFDKLLGHEFLAVHRIVKRYLDISPFRRIEAVVNVEFKEGKRWAELLGFEVECQRLRKYFESGNDAVLYVKVR